MLKLTFALTLVGLSLFAICESHGPTEENRPRVPSEGLSGPTSGFSTDVEEESESLRTDSITSGANDVVRRILNPGLEGVLLLLGVGASMDSLFVRVGRLAGFAFEGPPRAFAACLLGDACSVSGSVAATLLGGPSLVPFCRGEKDGSVLRRIGASVPPLAVQPSTEDIERRF